jgi:hypothetical protein
MTHWVAKKQTATIPITKALSLQVKSTEEEESGSRKAVKVLERNYQKTKVKGLLSIVNNRATKVNMIIHRKFYGKLLSADGKPELQHLTDGVWSINKRNKLTWKLSLKPGEKKQIKFNYSILVN